MASLSEHFANKVSDQELSFVDPTAVLVHYLYRKLTDIKNHYYSVLRKAIRLIKSWRFRQDPQSSKFLQI